MMAEAETCAWLIRDRTTGEERHCRRAVTEWIDGRPHCSAHARLVSVLADIGTLRTVNAEQNGQ